MKVVENSADFFIIEDKELLEKYTDDQEIYKKYNVIGYPIYIAKYTKLSKEGLYVEQEVFSIFKKVGIPILIVFLMINVYSVVSNGDFVVEILRATIIMLAFLLVLFVVSMKLFGIFLKKITRLVFDKKSQLITVFWYDAEGSYNKTYTKSDVLRLTILTADATNIDGTVDHDLFIAFNGESIGHRVAQSYNKDELIQLREKIKQGIGLDFD